MRSGRLQRFEYAHARESVCAECVLRGPGPASRGVEVMAGRGAIGGEALYSRTALVYM